ncbi:uncharacterized protein EI90DRAFT_3036955 [Cantharellus anzutake]|uniref:uncharacterized protein n=1 Tax=Cantharellus anzutake TaxID=1750568 RepID=UPI0019043B52|nr:uncharacterized protein EI90DRAFT_3036955 [Cantharellus anzutake]KAF8339528.1 hypothetical protein EI90DRAFT_3036955 [Cantharellus anzutake]
MTSTRQDTGRRAVNKAVLSSVITKEVVTSGIPQTDVSHAAKSAPPRVSGVIAPQAGQTNAGSSPIAQRLPRLPNNLKFKKIPKETSSEKLSASELARCQQQCSEYLVSKGLPTLPPTETPFQNTVPSPLVAPTGGASQSGSRSMDLVEATPGNLRQSPPRDCHVHLPWRSKRDHLAARQPYLWDLQHRKRTSPIPSPGPRKVSHLTSSSHGCGDHSSPRDAPSPSRWPTSSPPWPRAPSPHQRTPCPLEVAPRPPPPSRGPTPSSKRPASPRPRLPSIPQQHAPFHQRPSVTSVDDMTDVDAPSSQPLQEQLGVGDSAPVSVGRVGPFSEHARAWFASLSNSPVVEHMSPAPPTQSCQTLPYASWHCLRTPLDSVHFESFDRTTLNTWAKGLFNISGVYAVTQITATKTSSKYGKWHVAVLAKQRSVLDEVLAALSADSERYHAALQHSVIVPIDPFSGKEALRYIWDSRFDLHYIGLVWEEFEWGPKRNCFLVDAPPVLTNENIGDELLYHACAPLAPTHDEIVPRDAILTAFDFGPHVLRAWYDGLPSYLKTYDVTRFILVARAYDSAILKGKKAFMANIWRTKSDIDRAIRNLMLYLRNSDDAVQRVSKEKTESFQYLRGQRKWRLTVDLTVIDFCPYFRIE